jgi:hypothetical protein
MDSDGAAAELDVVLSDEPPQAVSTPAPPRAMMLAAAMLRPRRVFERMNSCFLSAPGEGLSRPALTHADEWAGPMVPQPFG